MPIDIDANRTVVMVELQEVASRIVSLDQQREQLQAIATERQDLCNKFKKLEGKMELLSDLQAQEENDATATS